ncbi:23S rRNA (uracil-C(5))-methyltransferase RlmCD [bioreactor metagenome]|uniref:23S rRNA (Uracil-C(5))-methyltransferase RlmCD n=1 Tax=bioreactor metagenome TaxID=1076179 RepID=A0A644YV57_9ZZZZ
MKKRVPPIQKNDMLELPIQGLTADGQGIGRVNGYAVFVAGALPGEVVRAHVIKVGNGYGVAKRTAILQKNPHRVEPPCEAFTRCGGCTLQHLDYSAQLAVKCDQVRDALVRLGGFSDIHVEPIIGMENPWRYRNKGTFPAGGGERGTEIGFFAPHSHRLVPLEDCPIQDARVMETARAVRDWARRYGVVSYDEETHRGTLRHAMARASQEGVMAVVVTAGGLPHAQELVGLLQERVASLIGVVHNRNDAASNVILGDQYETIWGDGHLPVSLCGLRFSVSAASFLQVNPNQTEALYTAALSMLDLKGEETVADVYCGIGTISLHLAKRVRHVIGIENVPQAVEDAKENALRNGICNAAFICASAEQALPALIKEGLRPDTIVVDPPRKGCDEAALSAIVASGAPRLLYISCDPATLARDCRFLAQGGFSILQVQPVDMFPHTAHVETVVLMSRVKD